MQTPNTPAPERCRFVIFDMDGVLLNSEPVHARCQVETLKSLGVQEAVDCNAYVGISSHKFWQDMIGRFSLPYTEAELFRKNMDHMLELVKDVPPSEGLLELLDRLDARGIQTAVASSSNSRLVPAVLHNLGITERFSAIVTGDDVKNLKPAPDIYQKAMALLGATPENTIAVEDSKSGLGAAVAAGLYAVGYVNPTSGPQDLSRADVHITKLLEILDLIG